jgi:protein SDA1
MLSAQAREASAKRALDLLVDLYRRRIWTDERCVNAIAQACLSKCTKVAVKAMHFFLGIETKMTEDEDVEASKVDKVEVATHQHSKKTKKRARMTQKQEEKKRRMHAALGKGVLPLFPALQMIRDPQGLCEKLFRRLRGSNEGFEVRLLMMNMVSRLIGCHQLVLLSFYGFVQRYLSNHQKEVTQILAFLVQASHALVPPDELVPLIRSIAFNFITERCAEEVMAVGLNAVREVCARVPAVLLETDMGDLMQDLVMYTRSHDKSVKMAARGLVNFVREAHPGALRGRDRGKGHAKGARPLAYGQVALADGAEGAELLDAYERGELDVDLGGSDSDDEGSDSDASEKKWKKPKGSEKKGVHAAEEGWEEASEESQDNAGEWEEVSEGGEAAASSGDDEDQGEDEEEEESVEEEEESEEEEEEEEEEEGEEEAAEGAQAPPPATRKKVGVDATRILTDEDFATIRRLREELGMGAHKGPSDDAFAATALEGYKVKRRVTIEEKMVSVLEGRNKFSVGGHAGGLTNKEKVRTKNYTMLRHSMKVKRKLQDSGKKLQHQANKQLKKLKKDSKDSKKRRRT